MDAAAYRALKALDIQLGTTAAEPAAALEAVRGYMVTRTLSVATADMRAILWARLEYAKLVLAAQNRDGSLPAQVQLLAITAVSLLDSGRTIDAADAAGWQSFVEGYAGLVGAGVLTVESQAAVLALRERQERGFPEDPTPDDMIAARTQF